MQVSDLQTLPTRELIKYVGRLPMLSSFFLYFFKSAACATWGTAQARERGRILPRVDGIREPPCLSAASSFHNLVPLCKISFHRRARLMGVDAGRLVRLVERDELLELVASLRTQTSCVSHWSCNS